MLECLNKECGYNKSGKCPHELVKKGFICGQRIEPTHTPTYAEEQLNHAIEKENKNSPNYEEEYHKLIKENEELKEINKNYEARLDNQGKRIKTDGNQIQKLFVEIDSLKLKAAVTEKLEIEINNLNAIIDGKDDKINELKKEIEENNEAIETEYQNKLFIAEQKINKLQGESNAFEKMVDILRGKSEGKDKEIEKFVTENTKLREVIKNIAEVL